MRTCISFGVRFCRICLIPIILRFKIYFMNTKGHCYTKAIILQAGYFKLRFKLSYRDIEEIMKMRGIAVDHATIQRWVFKFIQWLNLR